jgi:hypothetical protein
LREVQNFTSLNAAAVGQWSPSNPKGKKCYSVEFLLQFKDVNYQRPLDLECIPGFIARPVSIGV